MIIDRGLSHLILTPVPRESRLKTTPASLLHPHTAMCHYTNVTTIRHCALITLLLIIYKLIAAQYSLLLVNYILVHM